MRTLKRLWLMFGTAMLLAASPAFGDRSPTGTITTAAGCPGTACVVSDAHGSSTSIVTITGTWTGTLTFDVQKPDLTWVSVAVIPQGGGTPVTTTTANGTWVANVVPYRAIRVNGPTSTGSAVVSIETNAPQFFVPATAAQLAAQDGSTAALVAGPGEWCIQAAPVAATQATVSKAAGAAGVRHVARYAVVCVSSVAAQPDLVFNLRDGATGAGTVLVPVRVAEATVGGSKCVPIGPINAIGTAATAMTIESAAAPAASNFASVALCGYDAR